MDSGVETARHMCGGRLIESIRIMVGANTIGSTAACKSSRI
jgi:hypothetical protein